MRIEIVSAVQPFRIDIHHHLLAPMSLEILKKAGVARDASIGMGPGSQLELEQPWDLTRTLAMMDNHSVASTILSDFAAGYLAKDLQRRLALVRATNDFLAQIVTKAPGRFGAFASLPLPSIDAALTELTYALDTLHLDGVVLAANYSGQYLGDPAFEPLFAELHRRRSVVFIHPAPPSRSDKTMLKIPAFMLEFAFDTTRALTNLIFSGTLRRYPAITIICAHAGGVIPYLESRLIFSRMMTDQMTLAESAEEIRWALKKIYYDVALSASPGVFSMLQSLTDPSHLVFGSDCPPGPEQLMGLTIKGIESYPGFDEQARIMIERDNALALFPRLQALQMDGATR
ncbi:amidohydrolase [Ktedonosporobacter rubrisoli]|uniref:6-methylsalicylate decarboxylase n=1 Tax=Ktedonosporobacter rubrisoli TaxID=2509675 RepID=A0A4V0YYP1_KTERU|nr:amidohydrolase family protein [Ktedonosporobacter rubrisoli]QBD76901.1 amidohydrolase [Ktedonosporobacter rubrisoli]